MYCNFFIVAPCNNVQCGNHTDTCFRGICQCGNNPGLICNSDSGYPYCIDGSCGCTKTLGLFELGDGTTQGSCQSATAKCHLDGTCSECNLDSHCFGLSDTCTNGKCGCGSSSACDSTKSSACTNGVCKCGDQDSCPTSDMYFESLTDPRDNSVPGLQRSKNEICELVTEFYNPKFIPNSPLANNGTNSDGSILYAFEYDDQKGKNTGTYQCLGIV